MFYTSLYHTMINRSVYMDVDVKYRGLDHEIRQADGFTNYAVFSLWDTYRAEHPFLAPVSYTHLMTNSRVPPWRRSSWVM